MESITIFVISAIILLILGVNIATTLGISSVLFFILEGIPTSTVVQRLFSGIDIVALLCIPFFILAGDLMAKGGIARRLVNVVNLFIGNITGGLAYITIIVCAIFAAMTGSAMATCITIGTIMIPYMLNAGYSREFSTGVISAGAVLGPIIPPSTAMILYAVNTNTSVTELYLLGIPAGIIMALALCIVSYLVSRKNGYKGLSNRDDEGRKASVKQIIMTILGAVPAIGSPLIILGFIYTGICTPTESAVVAVIYSFLVGKFIYRELSFKDIPNILKNAAESTAKVMYIVSAAALFAWVITYERVPQEILSALLSLSADKNVIMLVIIIVLLIMGAVLEATPIILITVPMFLPVIQAVGIDPLHFGIVLTVAVCIGFVTPPFGTVLYTGMAIGNVSMQKLARQLVPFIIAMIISLLLIAFIPQLTMFIV
jgi:C4-dicarboxylate transporter DctM subunit